MLSALFISIGNIMKIESFEEYKAYYEKYHRLPLPQVSYSAKPLNDRQLLTKYNDYQKKVERADAKRASVLNDKEDSEFISDYTKKLMSAKQKARELDPRHEVYSAFLAKLSVEQRVHLKKNSVGVFGTFDPAHVFSCGEYPFMSDNVDNIVMIPRYLHAHIDQYLNPFIEGERLTEDEHTELWKLIIGEERYDKLQSMIDLHRRK